MSIAAPHSSSDAAARLERPLAANAASPSQGAFESPRGPLSMATLETPCGWLLAVSDSEGAAVAAQFSAQPAAAEERQKLATRLGTPWAPDEQPVSLLVTQLEEYFRGERRVFDLPLRPPGTAFRHRVWGQLLGLSFGETCSYGELAVTCGDPKASRAVGAANGANPLPIIIPCHRVLASTGLLHGYAGGLDRKAWLLRHEGISVVGDESSQLRLDLT